jgi:integrase
MKQRITDGAVERCQAQLSNGRATITDTDIKGFFVEVRRRSATFALRAQVAGKTQVIKLGNTPLINANEARALCLERKRALALGLSIEPISPRKELRCEAFVQEHYIPWYTLYRRKAENFTKTYRSMIAPRFGKLWLHEITRQHIQELAYEMRRAGYAAGTINNAVLVLRGMLKRADEWEVARVHPSIFKPAPLLQLPNHKERFLSQAEARRLQAELDLLDDTPVAQAIRFLLYTGTRKRETLDAEWQYVDMEQRTWRIPMTKNGKPRTVYLSEQAAQILEAARQLQQQTAQLDGNTPRWVFANPTTGRPYSCIYHTWNRVRQRAGLEDVRIHDLRHSFASTLVNAGVSLYEVQRLLGHVKASSTQRYAHLAKSKLQSTVQVVDRVYGRGRG